MKRVERVRLYPTRAQTGQLQFMLDVTRDIYNALLEQRREAFRRRGITVDAKEQYAELTLLRKADTRAAAVYRECEDAVLRRLELSFRAFYRRIRRGEKPGYPRFKPASRWTHLEFSHGNRSLRFNPAQSRVYVPGVGSVRLRKGRCVSEFRRAWITLRNGRWYACFECEREIVAGPRTGRIVGVDRGVHVLAATSDGELILHTAGRTKRHTLALMHQRELERLTVRDALGRVRNRHTKERQKAMLRFGRAKERETNAERDYLHKKARELVRSADTIVLEALDLRSMMRSTQKNKEGRRRCVRAKSALNRALQNARLGRFHRMIAYKAEDASRQVMLINARFSSQTCSQCGHCERENRRRARFHCVRCGFKAHADVNAACVIRRRAQLALMSEPDRCEEHRRVDSLRVGPHNEMLIKRVPCKVTQNKKT